ncbi:hypothetical protein [Brevibacillus brevis]|uniref:hypothetical protein n=1 Tax=Brevibacillus brevis TaxID=1393 RepID=UPI0007D8B437|nr:hypothetical protein [Brevibacillus brevis]
MATVKNLSFSHLKKEDAKKFKDKKQVLFNDGATKVELDLVFRPSKRNQVIADLYKLSQEKAQKSESVSGEMISAAMVSLIIKHFTTIDVKDLKTLDDYVELFIIMTDNDYLSPILNSFDRVELQSMIDHVNDQVAQWDVELRKVMDELKEQNNGS